VAYLDNLFGPQINNLGKALSRATERQALLTGNLANANVPGYKRRDIDFNIVLDDEMSKGSESFKEMQDSSAQRRSDRTATTVDGNNVDLEYEVMSLAETELRYQTLTEMTSRYFSNMKYVIREGK
jgi:flagellar basal-body rod protein FlgB